MLTAAPEVLAAIRARAVASEEVFVVDMPASAHRTRVYDEFLAALAATSPGDLAASAVSIVGPRNQVAKLVKGLSLLG